MRSGLLTVPFPWQDAATAQNFSLRPFPGRCRRWKNRAGKAYVFDADKKEPEKKDPGQVILDDSEKLIPEDIPHELIFRVGNPGSVLLDLSFEKTATWSSWATGAAALSRAFSWVPFPAIWQAT